jgi:predicted Zn finger-like uncharacterized protein
MGTLTNCDGKYATCTLHSARYEVLFSRFPATPAQKFAKEPTPVPSTASIQQVPSSDTVSIKCPHCATGYKVSTSNLGKNAKCKKCGLPFQISSTKSVQASVVAGKNGPIDFGPSTALQKPKCARHTTVSAEYVCARCGTTMCGTCVFARPDDIYLCPDCMLKENQTKTGSNLEQIKKLWEETSDKGLLRAATEDIHGYSPQVAWIIKNEAVKRGLISDKTASAVSSAIGDIQPSVIFANPQPVLSGQMCFWHPTVQAVQICKACGTAVCQTCDFLFPGNIHVCPRCATSRPQGLSGKRRTYMIWSYVLAVWSTLATIFFLSGAAVAMMGPGVEKEALGIMMSLFMLVPAIIGTALGSAAMERNSKPISVWIAAIWNGLIVALFILLCVVGIFMG